MSHLTEIAAFGREITAATCALNLFRADRSAAQLARLRQRINVAAAEIRDVAPRLSADFVSAPDQGALVEYHMHMMSALNAAVDAVPDEMLEMVPGFSMTICGLIDTICAANRELFAAYGHQT